MFLLMIFIFANSTLISGWEWHKKLLVRLYNLWKILSP